MYPTHVAIRRDFDYKLVDDSKLVRYQKGTAVLNRFYSERDAWKDLRDVSFLYDDEYTEYDVIPIVREENK